MIFQNVISMSVILHVKNMKINFEIWVKTTQTRFSRYPLLLFGFLFVDCSTDLIRAFYHLCEFSSVNNSRPSHNLLHSMALARLVSTQAYGFWPVATSFLGGLEPWTIVIAIALLTVGPPRRLWSGFYKVPFSVSLISSTWNLASV